MHVFDGLAAVFSGVDHCAITGGEPLGAGDSSRGPEKMTEQLAVLSVCLGDGRNVLAGNEEDVHRRLRLNVRERVTLVVLIDRFRRNTPVEDAAKETTHSSPRVYRLTLGRGQSKRQKLTTDAFLSRYDSLQCRGSMHSPLTGSRCS